MPNEKSRDPAANPDRSPLPGRRGSDDAPDASQGAGPSNREGLKRPRPVDLAEESAAGEEDPGAGLDVSIQRSPDAPDKV